MKKLHISLTLILFLSCLCSCQNDDTDFNQLLEQWKKDEQAKIPEAKEIEFNYTTLEEKAEEIVAGDNDFIENATFDCQINVHYENGTATVTGDVSRLTVDVNGAHVTVKARTRNVHYTLSGKTSNGSFKVYGEKKFAITLAGLYICNPTGAAINSQCGKTMYMVLAEGTSNTLADGIDILSINSLTPPPGNYTYVYTPGEDMKGTVFSEGQIVFSGKGDLRVCGVCRNGISSDDYIVVRPGTNIQVYTCAGHAIKANDGVTVRGSVLNLEVEGNASKGINSEAFVDIEGGRTTIISTGKSVVENNDTSTCACIKADSTFTLKAGIVNLKATGEGSKGINAKMNISIEGGELNVVSLGIKGAGSPKGIKSDADISLSGGRIYAYSLWALPVDAAGTLTIASGYKQKDQHERLWQVYY